MFLTVDVDDVSLTTRPNELVGITDVTGVYTGVQNVDIEIDTTDVDGFYTEGGMSQVYTVYDSDYYVIGAIVIGEATGSAQNLAYILSEATSEGRDEDGRAFSFHLHVLFVCFQRSFSISGGAIVPDRCRAARC